MKCSFSVIIIQQTGIRKSFLNLSKRVVEGDLYVEIQPPRNSNQRLSIYILRIFKKTLEGHI